MVTVVFSSDEFNNPDEIVGLEISNDSGTVFVNMKKKDFEVHGKRLVDKYESVSLFCA